MRMLYQWFKDILVDLILVAMSVITVLLACFSHSKVYGLEGATMRALIAKKCPNLSPAAINTSLSAYTKAKNIGLDDKNIFTIVDFSQPDYSKRFCTVNFSDKAVLYNAVVSHGVNSGGTLANSFSNAINSHKSMLGMYLTGETYFGKAGYSLKLYGLDKGLNDNAADRHVVVHGTPHVNDAVAASTHHVGHSLGCFGLSKAIAPNVIHTIAGGTLIFAYYPSKELIDNSIYLKDLALNLDNNKPNASTKT